MKRGVEQRSILQHSKADVQEFPHGSAQNDHLGFSALGKRLFSKRLKKAELPVVIRVEV